MKPALTMTFLILALAACGPSDGLSTDARRGESLVNDLGCATCHGENDGIGPSWAGTWGSVRQLSDGSAVLFDEAYVRSSIAAPADQIVEGFDPVMPAFSLSDAEFAVIATYLRESSR
jgi:cytochrome c oxidase subunit 2